MIVPKKKTINGIEYDYTYSDTGMYIERDGVPYTDALDPLDSGRVYIETDIPIEPENDEISAEEALAILMGEVTE